jgi:hypothetical protein
MSCYSGPNEVSNNLVGYLDVSNKKSYNYNLAAYTDNLSAWSVNGTLTTGQTDPLGGPNAVKVTATNTDPYITHTNPVVVSGRTYNFSVWMKGEGTALGKNFTFSVYDGTAWVSGSWSTNFVITNGWKRISQTFTPSNSGTAAIRFDCPESGTPAIGDVVYLYGVQFSEGSSLLPYISNPTFTTSTKIVDLSGNSFSGILVNIPPYSSTNNGYLTFNGTTQNITTTSVLVPVGATAYTVSVWYNRSRNNVVEELLSQWTTANSGNSFFFGFSSSNVRFTDSWNTISVAGAGTTGTWNNLVGVNTGTNAYIYLNGVLMATNGSALGYTGTGNFIIGNQSQNNAEYFQGSIANVQVYNIALTADQVKQNFNAIRGRYGI